MEKISELLEQSSFKPDELASLLRTQGDDKLMLFKKGAEVKNLYVGNKVYFRGLIEFSNYCDKDCYYCGIRKSNKKVHRYNLTDKEILDAARFAYENKFGSVVLQSGEMGSPSFTKRIEQLLREIKSLSNGELGITLSVGEQDYDVYKRWFEAGAHRYLLRIETTSEELYHNIHPDNHLHDLRRRMNCLYSLREIGYQTGTGVMIGLPSQTIEDLVSDLLFMRDFDVDMVGMGPYIEHSETPLYRVRDNLLPIQERFELSLKMISVLRIMMKDINIAAATALQAIDPLGRKKAVNVGANIIMPNITPGLYRNDYTLYDNKPCIDEEPVQCIGCLDARIALAENEIGYNEWGDSKHFIARKSK
jgi:biotin synthase